MKKNLKILNKLMVNRLKNIVLFFIFTAIFSTITVCNIICFSADLPASAQVTTATAKSLNPSTEKAVNEAKDTLKFSQKNGYDLNNPEKMNFGYAVYKFLLAMLGVIVSAGAIFFGLKIYKKFILKNDIKSDIVDYNNSLTSPKDFKEAINIFLGKTDRG